LTLDLSTDPRVALAEDVAGFYSDPLAFVLYCWPWGKSGFLEHHTGPDKWQEEALRRLGSEVRSRKFDGVHAVAPVRLCVVSGHGTGKSVLAAWITLWVLATRPYSRGVVTASTFQQLSTRTWAALSHWLKTSLIADWFEISSDRIWFKGQKDSWFAVAQTALEQNSESFAGVHAAGSSPFFIFDESSGIPDKIYEVSQGGTTDGEPFVVSLGNATRNSGWFYRACFGSDRANWIRFSVDSRTSKFANQSLLNEWIEQFGIGSDFVKIRILGEAPSASFSQFIGHDIVSLCRKYKATSYEHMPKVFGVDVARQGDDRSAIVCRQGRKVRLLAVYHLPDVVELAHRVAEFVEQEKPSAVVVDATGMGVGTYDELRHCGYGRYLHEFMAGGRASDPNAHANKRAEAWSLMRDALKAGLELPDSPDWETDLCGTEYGFNPKGAIQLEPKDAMKSRGLSSPDLADALSMTFSVRVAPTYHVTVSTPRTYSVGQDALQWMR
jgi:hypothetical protein